MSPFTSENEEVTLYEWLPSLDRAAHWNAWTEEDQLLQPAGHLRGKALQEGNLIPTESKRSLSTSVQTLKGRLDPARQAMAAQEFRHLTQNEQEPVGDFITRLEKTFMLAYRKHQISPETREAFLYA